MISGKVTYDFGWASLTSVSAYQTTRMQYLEDISVRWVPLLQSLYKVSYYGVGLEEGDSTDKFTEELRLSSPGKGPLEWVVGLFYNDEKSDRSQDVIAYEALDQAAAPDPATFLSPTRYTEYAAFGDLTWHITSRFNVTGGLRYASDRQKYEQAGTGLIKSEPQLRSTEDVVTYLANTRYQFNENTNAYFRYATGYRPGGPNFQVVNPTTGQVGGAPNFQADTLSSYEVGLKTETSDRTLGLDIDAYHVNWNNIQVLTSVGGLSAIVNAPGGARVDGAELAVTARPASFVELSGNAAYANARLKQADPALGASQGERMPNVPKFTAALNADFRLALPLQPTVGGSVRWVGDRMASFDKSAAPPQYRLPAYAAADLHALVNLRSVSLQLYVHNLFDKRGELNVPNTIVQANGPRPVSILEPRTVGVSAMVNF